VDDDKLNAELARLDEEIGDAADALVLYGSAARGDYRPRQSDVNLAVVLASGELELIERLAKPLRHGFRSIRLHPFLIERAEIPRAADVFPIKLLDIQAHHRVLRGTDPFVNLSVTNAHLRLRIEQALRNHLMRVRRRYMFLVDDPSGAVRLLDETAAGLTTELEALLTLTDDDARALSRLDVLQRAATRLDIDSDTFARLLSVRAGQSDPDPMGLVRAVMDALRVAVGYVDSLEGA